MRSFILLLSLLALLALTACGTEKELIPPSFTEVTASGSLGSVTVLTTPSQDSTVTIKGNIDDVAATIVANSTVTGEVSVDVNSDGSWSFPFDPQEGANIVSFTASDARGNINQMILTVVHDTTAPLVTAVTQSIDPPPQLIVTFDEALLASSLATALFAVDNTPITAASFDPLTPNTVTLPLPVVLPAGPHTLTCSGVTDLSTLDGNSIAVGYSFDFTIAE
jgi:hypothetical protein